MIEGTALERGDQSLAVTASFGAHLADLTKEIRASGGIGSGRAPTYRIDAGRVVLLRDPVNPQAYVQLGVLASGQVTRRGSTSPFATLYLVTKIEDHYLVGDTLPVDSPMIVGGAS